MFLSRGNVKYTVLHVGEGLARKRQRRKPSEQKSDGQGGEWWLIRFESAAQARGHKALWTNI